jgi:LCP family protein required for cell wall assembly
MRLLAQFGYMMACLGAVLTLVLGLGGYYVYAQLTNFNKVFVGGLSNRYIYGQQNILVLGSQTRLHQHGWFGSVSGGATWTSNSDNLLVVHLDATHTHAMVLSIPRDLITYEPACEARIRQIGIGLQGPYQNAIIDGALNIGGPTCAVRTVEDLTGVKFDHFVMFDFNSFRTMVDAIGGVEVCVPAGGYHDAYSHLNLGPGLRHLTYNQALAYVRTRHGVGSGADAGGDLGRITLQQAFMSSVIQEVNKNGLLGNALSLYNVAKTAASALTVDQGLGSPTALLHFGKSLVGLHAKDVSFITMPTIFDPANQNRLLPQLPQADVLFQMIVSGQNWRGHLPFTAPRDIQVRVLNGTGVYHLAKRTANALTALGFKVIGIGPGPTTATTTVSYSGTAQADAAYTLMRYLHSMPAAQNLLTEPTPQTGTQGPITLTLGADYASFTPNPPPVKHPAASPSPGATGAKPKPAGGSSPPVSSGGGSGDISARSGGANICSGLPPPR